MKYAFCIPIYNTISGRLLPQFLNLQDWSKQMSADIKDYYDVFGELYEKYNRPGKSMPPELKLVLILSNILLPLNSILIKQKPIVPSIKGVKKLIVGD